MFSSHCLLSCTGSSPMIWAQKKYFALVAVEGVCRDGRPGDHASRRSSLDESRGVFLSNGPEDPATLHYARETIREN